MMLIQEQARGGLSARNPELRYLWDGKERIPQTSRKCVFIFIVCQQDTASIGKGKIIIVQVQKYSPAYLLPTLVCMGLCRVHGAERPFQNPWPTPAS